MNTTAPIEFIYYKALARSCLHSSNKMMKANFSDASLFILWHHGWYSLIVEKMVIKVVLTKTQLFNFTKKDSGARCWGKRLLAQKNRKSTQLTFLLHHPPSNHVPSTNSIKSSLTSCPFPPLPVHLSLRPSDSSLFSIFFLTSPVFTSCQMVAPPLDLWLT